jgi:hypothetical protein
MPKKQKRNTTDNGTKTKKQRCGVPVPSDAKDSLTTTEEFQRQLRVSQNSTRFQSYLVAGEFKKALAVAKECKNELDNANVHVSGHSSVNPIRIFMNVEAADGTDNDRKTSDHATNPIRIFMNVEAADGTDNDRKTSDHATWNEVCEVFMKTGAEEWLLVCDDEDHGPLVGCESIAAPFRAIIVYAAKHAEWALPELLTPRKCSSLLHDAVSQVNPMEIVTLLFPHVPLAAFDWIDPTNETTALQNMCWNWKDSFDNDEHFVSLVGLFMTRIPYVNPHLVDPKHVSGVAKDMIISGCKKYDEYFAEWRSRAIREVLSYQSETSASPVPLIPELVDIIIGYLGNVL